MNKKDIEIQRLKMRIKKATYILDSIIGFNDQTETLKENIRLASDVLWGREESYGTFADALRKSLLFSDDFELPKVSREDQEKNIEKTKCGEGGCE